MRTHVSRRRSLGSTLVVAALVLLTALPAAAGTGPGGRDRDRRIAVGDIRVASGEVIDGPVIGIDGDTRIAGRVDGAAVVVRGDLTVTAAGEVDGNIIVVRGDARIDGSVDGDVVVIGGRATVGAGADIDGDVSSSDEPRVARGARVSGDVEDIDLAGIIAALGAGILLFWWFAVTLSTAVLGALLLAFVPRALETGAGIGRDPKRWWIALLTGAGLLVGLPVLGVAAVSSLLGLPFGFGILGALGLVHAIGYVAGAFFLGRLILKEPKNRFGAFFVGWAILRVAALAPILGVLVWIAAALYGMGMLAVAAFRAGQVPRAGATPTAPTTPTAPSPPAEPTRSTATTTPTASTPDGTTETPA